MNKVKASAEGNKPNNTKPANEEEDPIKGFNTKYNTLRTHANNNTTCWGNELLYSFKYTILTNWTMRTLAKIQYSANKA